MHTNHVPGLVDFFASEARATGHTSLGRQSIGEHPAPVQERELLAALLTVRPPWPIPSSVSADLDALLDAEAASRPVVRVDDVALLANAGVSGSLGCASLWQGDITTLGVDAIVNAANSQMLGCFVPNHRCIDNAIHAAAGPGLRSECADILTAQRHPEPTGRAHLTAGYHLPARHVVHTVGPIVADHRPTSKQVSLLASSYRSSLDVAHRAGDRSIAFCSISTGVFGYPIRAAAHVALEEVKTWLTDHPGADLHVVFNTFSDHDTVAFRRALAERTAS